MVLASLDVLIAPHAHALGRAAHGYQVLVVGNAGHRGLGGHATTDPSPVVLGDGGIFAFVIF